MGWIKERILSEYLKHGNRLDWALIAEKKIVSQINEMLKDSIVENNSELCILCKKNKENHIPSPNNDNVFWCYDNKKYPKKWAYQFTTKEDKRDKK